jgi:hypothetical protein
MARREFNLAASATPASSLLQPIIQHHCRHKPSDDYQTWGAPGHRVLHWTPYCVASRLPLQAVTPLACTSASGLLHPLMSMNCYSRCIWTARLELMILNQLLSWWKFTFFSDIQHVWARSSFRKWQQFKTIIDYSSEFSFFSSECMGICWFVICNYVWSSLIYWELALFIFLLGSSPLPLLEFGFILQVSSPILTK